MMKFKCGVILLMFISIWGCSNSNDKSVILDASGNHPAGWVVANTGGNHPAAYLSLPDECKGCHGSDLKGGVSKVSCFSADRNGMSCHAQGPSGSNCTGCHGPLSTTIFNSLAGVTATSDPKVGAHVKHLNASLQAPAYSANIACSECHTVPTTPSISGTHRNGTNDIIFGTLAKTGSLTPVYTAATGVCTNTYCHGTTLTGGGTNKSPVWNQANYLAAGCSTCHGFPPTTVRNGAAAHSPSSACSGCHTHVNPSNNGFTAAGVALHINGTVESSGGGAGHGGAPYDTHNAAVVAAGGNTACLVVGCHAMGTAASGYPAAGPPDCMSCHKKAAPLHTGTAAGANCSSCHGVSTATGTSICRPSTNNGTFPDTRNSHNAASAHTNAACTVCHVLGASGGSGSGINHGRGSTAGPVRDGKPGVVGPFVIGVTVTGGSRGVAPSVSCDHTFGCGHTNSTETW